MKTVSFVAVAPIKVDVNPGARPVCRTTCPRVRAGMEKSSKQLNDILLKSNVIKRWVCQCMLRVHMN